MPMCCNYQCSNETFGRKIRCGTCRRKKELLCKHCGKEHDEDRAVYCKECSFEMKRLSHQISDEKLRFAKFGNRKCKVCGSKVIPGSNRRTICSKKCVNEQYINTINNRKHNTNCFMCEKDLRGTGKQNYCSDECYGYMRKIYLHYRRNTTKPLVL